MTVGLIPVLATPFRAGGELDLGGLRRLMDFQAASGVDGVAVFGFASEGFALTAAERSVILKTVAEYGLAVVAGVGAAGTREAVEQAQVAASLGAAAVMVLPPYLVKPSPAQITDFFGEVGREAGVPVMVQDAPAATGVTMAVQLIAELSKLDGVASVKVEAQPTAPKVGAVVAATAADFLVLGGQNALFVLEEYDRGAVGTMPACEFPDLLAPVLRSRSREGFNRLLPLIRYGLQPGIAWSIHKHVLVRRGIIESAAVRAPAVDADAATLAWLDDLLRDLGLL